MIMIRLNNSLYNSFFIFHLCLKKSEGLLTDGRSIGATKYDHLERRVNATQTPHEERAYVIQHC